MKQRYCLALLFAVIFASQSCISDNTYSDISQDKGEKARTLEDLITRSNGEQPDSLTMMNIIQADVDNLMINRVTFRDGEYILTIKREDALFLGVSEEVYDDYVEYVATLNANNNL